MGAPTIYKYTDTDAPIANGVNTSLNSILYACLVTGYGSKAAAGWTREFVNAGESVGVYRNNSVDGTGMYLRVDQTIANNYAVLHGYETMTDVDTGSGRFNTGTCYCATSSNSSTTNRPWMLIADDKGFYFFCYTSVTDHTGTGYTICNMYFGDIISLFDPDPYGCALFGSQSTTNASYMGYVTGLNAAGSAGMYLARKADGVNQIVGTCTPYQGCNVYTNVGSQGVDASTVGYIVSGPVYINDGATYSVRGYVPGLYYTGNIYTSMPDNWEELTIGSKTFMCMHGRGYSSHNYLMIDIGDTFRP